jgi:hypothetical protein
MKSIFTGFGKAGEKVSEENGVYCLSGKGTDIGCVLELEEEIKRPSLLELEIRGEIVKSVAWARLRVEIYDRENADEPATSYENEYLPIELDAENFKHLSLPILGIVKHPWKVQFMVVGPAKTRLEIKNVNLR